MIPLATNRTFSFTSRPEAVTAARQALHGFDELLELGLFYDASLCTSELVTLAVMWADGDDSELQLDVSIREGSLRVTVSGPAANFDPAQPSADSEDGLGLYIVDRLSSRWGIERGSNALVWFEMGAVPRGSDAGGKSELEAVDDAEDVGRVRRRRPGIRGEPVGAQPQTALPYLIR